MILLLAFLLNAEPAFSKISLIEEMTPETLKNAKEYREKQSKSTLSKKGSDAILKKIHEQNERLNALFSQKTDRPYIWSGETKIETAKAFKGLLLNSVVSTNLESPLLVQVFRDQKLPVGTKFSCKGITKNKRVLTYCDRMITPTREIEVKVQILNLDGSAGLRGQYSDGKDSYIAGAVISDLAKGIISTSTRKVSGGSSIANEIIEGLKSSGNTTTDALLEESKNQEPKIFIEAGKPVLIYFMEGLDAY